MPTVRRSKKPSPGRYNRCVTMRSRRGMMLLVGASIIKNHRTQKAGSRALSRNKTAAVNTAMDTAEIRVGNSHRVSESGKSTSTFNLLGRGINNSLAYSVRTLDWVYKYSNRPPVLIFHLRRVLCHTKIKRQRRQHEKRQRQPQPFAHGLPTLGNKALIDRKS